MHFSSAQLKRELWRVQADVSKRLAMSTGKNIYRLGLKDQMRLVKLLVWEERYSVPLEYIFHVLIPHCQRRMPPEVRRKVQSGKSLGVKLTTLTSLASERYLQKCVEEDYPDGMNVRIAREKRREKMIGILMDGEEVTGRGKRLLDCATPEEYVERYRKRLKRLQTQYREIDKQMTKMPYRSNPWL